MHRYAAVAFLSFSLAGTAQAMPNFARREGFDCRTCHTTIPRLNRFGYDYRNAGFRVPESIGDKKQKDLPALDSMFSARMQLEPIYVRTRAPGVDTTNRWSLPFFEWTLYPLTGAFGRWWSSEGELSFAPGAGFEVENAYLRATFGGAASRFNVRAGVFHPWEGYGASDRPIAINRTLFQRVPARWGAGGQAAQQTYFTPWGFDQAGVEVGYTMGGLNVAASVLNGLVVHEEGGALIADPFQGGDFTRNTRTDPNYNAKDFQVFANQFFGDAALSAHYYHGTLSIPTPPNPDPAGPFFSDKFDRISVYGTLPLPRFGPQSVPPLSLLAGYMAGWDKGYDQAAATTSGKVRSSGWFGEVDAALGTMVGVALRYDRFDPSNKASTNEQQAIVGAVNVAALNGAQGILEYRHRLNEANAGNTNTDEVRLRVLYIF